MRDPEQQQQAISTHGANPGLAGLPAGQAIPPLNVSGLVVTRADLVAALRVYVARLADITPLEGDRFLLTLMR